MLNFTAYDWQLLIGNWDITSLVSALVIRRPRAEINTPYRWQGNLVLSTPLTPTLPESLDDLENPTRWAIGISPIRFYIRGVLVATLRIQRYFYDENTRQGQVELTDQLGLRDYQSPPKDFEGLGFKVGDTSANTVVNTLLSKTGLGSNVNVPGRFEVPPNKFSESYISLAQTICGERGYWLYCSPSETISSSPYPNRSVLFQRPRSQIKDFERQSGLEIPAELVRVTGSCEKVANCGKKYPEVSEEYALLEGTNTKGLQRRETINFTESGNTQTRTIQTEQALGICMPDSYPGSTTVVTTEVSTESNTYDKKGRLTNTTIKINKLLGLALPNEHPGSKSMISSAEKVIEEYSWILPGTSRQDDGILRYKKRTVWSLYPAGAVAEQKNILTFGDGYSRAVKEQIIETWAENGSTIYSLGGGGNQDERPKCQRYEYRRVLYQRSDVEIESNDFGSPGAYQPDRNVEFYKLGELLYKGTIRKPDQPPPAWPTKEPDNPLGTITILGEARFASASHSPYVEKEFETSASTLTSNYEAQRLATLIGNLQHQRYYSRYVTIPVLDEWLNNPTPFSVVHIHNGAFVIDSPAIAIEKQGERYTMAFSFIGNYLGRIPVIPGIPPETPSFPISPYIEIAQILDVFDTFESVTLDDIYDNSLAIDIFDNFDTLESLNPYLVFDNFGATETISDAPSDILDIINFIEIIDADGAYSVTDIFSANDLLNYPMSINK